MITDVFIVYNDPSQRKRIEDSLIRNPLFFTYIDENSKNGRKEAFALKSHWGARMTPFILCMNKDKAIKAFYSENDKDVINSLINYLNDIYS